MATESVPPIVLAVQEKLRRLADDRASLVRALKNVDDQIAAAASALGLDVSDIAVGDLGPTVERPKRGRSREGTLTEFVMKRIAESENGVVRQEVIDAVSASEFADQYRRNPNGLYNLILRALSRGEIVEREGRRLYYFPKAPPEGGKLSDSYSSASLLPFPKGGGNG